MAKNKKLTAKVNGVKLKNGDKVTIVIQATVKVDDKTRFDGTEYREVEFVSKNQKHFLDAWETDDRKFDLSDAVVVKR